MTEGPKDNVFSLVNGGKTTKTENTQADSSANDYIIVDREGNEYYYSGFLVFTSQHIAIMREVGGSAIPIFVIPLDRVHSAEIVEEVDEDISLPF